MAQNTKCWNKKLNIDLVFITKRYINKRIYIAFRLLQRPTDSSRETLAIFPTDHWWIIVVTNAVLCCCHNTGVRRDTERDTWHRRLGVKWWAGEVIKNALWEQAWSWTNNLITGLQKHKSQLIIINHLDLSFQWMGNTAEYLNSILSESSCLIWIDTMCIFIWSALLSKSSPRQIACLSQRQCVIVCPAPSAPNSLGQILS